MIGPPLKPIANCLAIVSHNLVEVSFRALTNLAMRIVANVPVELEWLADVHPRTHRAY